MTRPKLTGGHYLLVAVIAAGAVAISAIGFAGSYSAVRSLAEQYGFGVFAKVLPLGIDAGIAVLLALDLLLSWLRMPYPALRHMAWLLTAATIFFNAKVAWPDPTGVALHAVIPLLFVIVVEAGRHAVARLANVKAGREEMEGLGIARWVLSPFRTFALWRRKHLWGIGSRDTAIRVEQQRLVYRAQLRRHFGRSWRRSAPQDALVPLQLAALGVPLHLTYAAGLQAAGVSASTYASLFTDPEEREQETAVAGRQRPVLQPAASAEDPIAQRAALVVLVQEAVAQALAAQSPFAQDGPARPAAAQERPAHGESAQTDQGSSQVMASAEVLAQPGPANALSARSSAQSESGDTQWTVGLAQDGTPEGGLRTPRVQADAGDPGDRTAAEPIPAARVARLDAAGGRVVTEQADTRRIPGPWAEAFQAFVHGNGRHPEQGELAQYLYDRHGVKARGKDEPVSLHSVRRYYAQLQEAFPLEDQQQLDLAALGS